MSKNAETVQPEKPTRIISPPTKGYKGICLYTCNNGYTYSLDELQEVTGLSKYSLSQRIRIFGFDSDMVFMPRAKRGFRIDGESVNNQVQASGNEAMKRLSGKVRSKNLSRIPPPGTLEQRYL